ncbi:MAG: hypothetical protein BJ554DRAFT_6535 [Olpidium bornovanus]|uniref:Uncharacterized protein n=1 Tax=Olpidium bornovanus TaxID=278681 RepID=A0A8H7ZXM4_9FUNG|nr:MAG: hypothetical protein BJ554DRAFT_6535 [Olpidium bornovanus]
MRRFFSEGYPTAIEWESTKCYYSDCDCVDDMCPEVCTDMSKCDLRVRCLFISRCGTAQNDCGGKTAAFAPSPNILLSSSFVRAGVHRLGGDGPSGRHPEQRISESAGGICERRTRSIKRKPRGANFTRHLTPRTSSILLLPAFPLPFSIPPPLPAEHLPVPERDLDLRGAMRTNPVARSSSAYLSSSASIACYRLLPSLPLLLSSLATPVTFLPFSYLVQFPPLVRHCGAFRGVHPRVFVTERVRRGAKIRRAVRRHFTRDEQKSVREVGTRTGPSGTQGEGVFSKSTCPSSHTNCGTGGTEAVIARGQALLELPRPSPSRRSARRNLDSA